MASYYEYVRKHDVLLTIAPHIKSGVFKMRMDGQIEPTQPSFGYDSPWVFAKTSPSKACNLWHQVMFNIFGILPSPCFFCYKVVCRPRTVTELMELENLQKMLDLPSKCGIEIRETVNGLYGGYFYSESLEKGKELYQRVRDEIDTHISTDMPVILKRGCTEFELKFGRSDEWEKNKVPENQVELEHILTNLFVFDKPNPTLRPDHIIDYKHAMWINWAYKNGDNSYLQLTDGKRLYPSSVTYHEEKKDGKKEVLTDKKRTGSNSTKAGSKKIRTQNKTKKTG